MTRTPPAWVVATTLLWAAVLGFAAARCVLSVYDHWRPPCRLVSS